MIIQVDSREKLPYDFSAFEGVQTETGTLAIGDYSLKDCGHLIACERKSLPDLIACLSHERERFSRELLKARQLEAFAVVCECTWQEIAGGTYRSGLNPAAAILTAAGGRRLAGVALPWHILASTCQRIPAALCLWTGGGTRLTKAARVQRECTSAPCNALRGGLRKDTLQA